MDVWDNTSGSDGDVRKELVEFFIVPHSEHDVPWADPGLLVVTSGVTGKFENFDSEVFEDGSKEDWSASADTVAITALTKESVETTDWELKTGTG